MGLDTVELVISIEQSFGIQIPNEVAPMLETPGQVIDYIHSLQPKGDTHACLPQRAFHRLRRAFIALGLCSREEFKLETDLRNLVPPSQRRRVWKTLRLNHGLKLPPLKRHPMVSIGLATLLFVISFVISSMWSDSVKDFISFTLILLCVLGIMTLWLTTPLAIRIQPRFSTPEMNVSWLSRSEPGSLIPSDEPLSRSQIADTVRTLTLDYCDERDYRESAHFVKDLGLG